MSPVTPGRQRRRLSGAGALALVLAVGATTGSGAEPQERAKLRLNTLASFDQPTFVSAPEGAGELAFVVEREGKIRLLEGERKQGTFLDMKRWVSCCRVETGLFSVAFAPDYERTRRFYVYFTNRQDNIEIDEFKAQRNHPRKADRGSRRKLLEIKQTGEVNHNGGTVAFGPDGYLYAATGDGGRFDNPSANAQKKGSLLGKLLRIDPRKGKRRPYRIPPSNPFAGKPGQNEIYARGLRNPFRFSFDGNRILIGDVGQSRREEVDIETAPQGEGRELRLERLRGLAALPAGQHRPSTTKPAAPVLALGLELLDHRRGRGPRRAPAEVGARSLRLRRLLLGLRPQLRSQARRLAPRQLARRRQPERDRGLRHRRPRPRLRGQPLGTGLSAGSEIASTSWTWTRSRRG